MMEYKIITSRYFSLFSKKVQNEDDTVLLYVCRLFACDNVKMPVVDVILSIVENLFTFEDVEEDLFIDVKESVISFKSDGKLCACYF